MSPTDLLVLSLLLAPAKGGVPSDSPPAVSPANDGAASLAKIASTPSLPKHGPALAKLSSRARLADLAGAAFDGVARPVIVSLARPIVGNVSYSAVHVAFTDPVEGAPVFHAPAAEAGPPSELSVGYVMLGLDVQGDSTYAVECGTSPGAWTVWVMRPSGDGWAALEQSRIAATDKPSVVFSATEDTRMWILVQPQVALDGRATVGRCQVARMVIAK